MGTLPLGGWLFTTSMGSGWTPPHPRLCLGPPPGTGGISTSPALPTLMRFRELILGAQEQSCQLGPFIMGPISRGGSRRGDESLSPCVNPPPPQDLPLLCGSSCSSATGKPSASLGHIQVNASPECIPAAKAGFEEHPKSRRLLAHAASACGNRWSPAPWGSVSRAGPHLSPLLLPSMENHAHAHARVGGAARFEAIPGSLELLSGSALRARSSYLCLCRSLLNPGTNSVLTCFHVL